MTIAERISAERKAKGLTQKELGQRLGIGESSISQYESGARNPKPETLRRIADALNCDFYWLLFEKDFSTHEKATLDTVTVFNIQDPHQQRVVEVVSARLENAYKNIGYSFSNMELQVVQLLSKLNDDGQRKAMERVGELTEVSRYLRQTSPPPAAELLKSKQPPTND